MVGRWAAGSAVPTLFAAAGTLDGANCALQVMTVSKSLLAFAHAQWHVGASVVPTLHWALAQLPTQASLMLAASATVAAVIAELKAEQVAEVHGEESPVVSAAVAAASASAASLAGHPAAATKAGTATGATVTSPTAMAPSASPALPRPGEVDLA